MRTFPPPSKFINACSSEKGTYSKSSSSGTPTDTQYRDSMASAVLVLTVFTCPADSSLTINENYLPGGIKFTAFNHRIILT